MTAIHDEITAALRSTPTEVDTSLRQYALEAGLRVSPITGARPHRVDSAVLVGFINNWLIDNPARTHADLADAIVNRFNLYEEQ